MTAAEESVDLRSFEGTFAELEELVHKLEAGALTLDESLACYERGVGALKRCYRILDVAEKRLEVLVRDGDGALATRPLDLAEVRGEARGAAKVAPPAPPAPEKPSSGERAAAPPASEKPRPKPEKPAAQGPQGGSLF